MSDRDDSDWRVSRTDEDPMVQSSRREMYVVLGFAIFFTIWSGGYCALHAYDKPADGEEISLVMGMPSWVFWGVILPWAVAAIFTVWFALGFMKDHELDDHAKSEGSDPEPPAIEDASGGEPS